MTGDVMKMALSKGEGEESVQAHKVCCTMLGAIAPMLEANDIIQNFLPKTMGFCQVSYHSLLGIAPYPQNPHLDASEKAQYHQIVSQADEQMQSSFPKHMNKYILHVNPVSPF